MPVRHSPVGLRADAELGPLRCVLPYPADEWSVRAPLSCTAFCRDHWPVYARFGYVASGSTVRGADLALTALRGLADQWPAVLR